MKMKKVDKFEKKVDEISQKSLEKIDENSAKENGEKSQNLRENNRENVKYILHSKKLKNSPNFDEKINENSAKNLNEIPRKKSEKSDKIRAKNLSTKKYSSRARKFARVISQRILLKNSLKTVLKIRVKNRENLAKIDKNSPLIIVANHNSHFDAPLVITNLPRKIGVKIATAAAADTFFTRKTKAKMTRVFFNAFPVERKNFGEKKFKGLAEKIVEAKIPLLIFPEGTRSRDGNLGEFHSGAARICIKNRAQILPIILRGTFAAWPPNAKKWRKNRPEVSVEFGEIILPFSGETAENLTARLRKFFAEKLGKTKFS